MSALLPDTAAGNDGSSLIAWAEYLSGSSGDMRIKVRYRAAGEAAFASAVTVTDTTGSEIHCVDGGFGNICHASAQNEPWTMAIVYTGETDVSCWYCDAERSTGAWSFTRV